MSQTGTKKEVAEAQSNDGRRVAVWYGLGILSVVAGLLILVTLIVLALDEIDLGITSGLAIFALTAVSTLIGGGFVLIWLVRRDRVYRSLDTERARDVEDHGLKERVVFEMEAHGGSGRVEEVAAWTGGDIDRAWAAILGLVEDGKLTRSADQEGEPVYRLRS